jgi:uncharacterized RDD family membrane protein YckC
MEYSSIKRRLAAYIIDLVVVLGGGMLFLVGVMSVALGDQNPSEDSIWLILLPFVTTWLYFILCYIFAGVTLGKKLLGIKLVRENGKALNPIVVVMREAMKLFSLGLLNGLFSMFHDTNRRTWYDKAAVIQLDRHDDVLYVPNSAVQTDSTSGTTYVRQMKNGKVVQTPVEIGLKSDTSTEIISGLKEGDSVITSIVTATSGSSSSGTTSPFSTGNRGFGGAVFGGGGGGGNRTVIRRN